MSDSKKMERVRQIIGDFAVNKGKVLLLLSFLLFIVAAYYVMPPVEVTALEIKPQSAPMTVDGIGHVTALRSIGVRSQVTGVIKKTLFAEGDVVTEGQPLLVINPDAYKAQLDEAVNTLAKDRATAAQNRRDWLRYKDLVAQGVVSQDDYEQKRTTYKQAAEQVRVDEASVVNAKVSLDYCYINAPCTGVVGLQSYKTGNLVEANKDVIVTVNQIEPVNVQFSVAEKYLPELRDYAAKGSLVVEASYPNHPDKVSKGTLSVINNTVDTTTGTIVLQGEFRNKDHLLWPGQFVNATVVLTMPATDGEIAVVKTITVHPANRDRPVIQGEITVLEAATGRRLGVLDGPTVTARRTAAVSLLAAKRLSPPEDGPLLVIGAGVQARAHGHPQAVAAERQAGQARAGPVEAFAGLVGRQGRHAYCAPKNGLALRT